MSEGKRIEFEKLEQREGTHTVPVKMTREELEEVASQMSDLTTRIEAREKELRDFQKEMREAIKQLETERSAQNNIYRFKREPKPVAGLWGFDFEDHGTVKCRTCFERDQKLDNGEPEDGGGVNSYNTDAELVAAHEQDTVGEAHQIIALWQRPLGTKWFVDPNTGDVFGPVMIVEKDLQRELLPETKTIEPFALQFDVDSAVPLLDANQVSAAEAKLRETEKGIDRANDDTTAACPDCGLPLIDHEGTLDGGGATITVQGDPCKTAMLVNADRANKEQAKRTEERYGADATLEPDQTYGCGKCGTSTFGKDLQPVVIDGKGEFVCFSCEQGIQKDVPAAEPKKKRTRKPKKQGEAQA